MLRVNDIFNYGTSAYLRICKLNIRIFRLINYPRIGTSAYLRILLYIILKKNL